MISLMNPIMNSIDFTNEPIYDFSNEPFYQKWTLLSEMSPIIRNEPYY